jgi:hypothetical protein
MFELLLSKDYYKTCWNVNMKIWQFQFPAIIPTDNLFTDHSPWDYLCGEVGVYSTVQGSAGYRVDYQTAIVRRNTVLLVHTDWKHQAFWIACSECIVRMFSGQTSNSSFTMISCACPSVSFPAGIISWSVNSIDPLIITVLHGYSFTEYACHELEKFLKDSLVQ